MTRTAIGLALGGGGGVCRSATPSRDGQLAPTISNTRPASASAEVRSEVICYNFILPGSIGPNKSQLALAHRATLHAVRPCGFATFDICVLERPAPTRLPDLGGGKGAARAMRAGARRSGRALRVMCLGPSRCRPTIDACDDVGILTTTATFCGTLRAHLVDLLEGACLMPNGLA